MPNKKYKIEIFDDPLYDFKSVDNAYSYQKIFCDENANHKFSSKHGITIEENGIVVSSAIVCGNGGGTGIHEKSYLIENDEILLCCGNQVYCLSIPDLNLNWVKEVDFATCFGIYSYDGDFIIHGELEVSRLTGKGVIKWQFSGRDIFVTPNGKQAFEIKESKIYLTDWENNQYVLDKNSKQIL